MNLFSQNTAALLPFDGEALYIPAVLPADQALSYFHTLMEETPWQNDRVRIYGKEYVTERRTAWYGDPGAAYTYSGVCRHPLPWTAALLALKALAEMHIQTEFNSCLLNAYRDGSEGMGWHSDDEKELDPQAPIASLSLGSARRFLFRHRRLQEQREIVLENGSLLLMQGEIQQYWKHSLPKSMRVKSPRINLTFRRIL